MNVWQWVLYIFVAIIVLTVTAFLAMMIYYVHQEQQYRLRQKYAPKTDKELEQLGAEVIAQILARDRQDRG